MAKNQINITLASYNYLYEVQAIPKNVRLAYLDLLSRQKGKDRQKRVLVLKFIYKYADENTISRWDPQLICKTLGIRMDMLYCYKSRLLKGLRKHYFNWETEEKKIEESFAITLQASKGQLMPNLIERRKIMEMKFAKARRMAELGMLREAKSMYLQLKSKGMNDVNLGIAAKNLLMSEIYEFLVFYYYNKRKRTELKFYNKELQNVCNVSEVMDQYNNKKDRLLLAIRKQYSDFYLAHLEWYSNNYNKIDTKNIEKIYSLAKAGNYSYYIFKSLHHRVIHAITGNEPEAARDLCMEGYYRAKELGDIPVTYLFLSILYYLRTIIPVPKIRLSYDEISNYYRRAKKTIPLNQWTVFLENAISIIYYPDVVNKAPELLLAQANTNIMLGDQSMALLWIFMHSSESYYKKLLGSFAFDSDGILEMNEAPVEITKEIDNTCFNTLCYHKALTDLPLLIHVYNMQLTVSFFREKNFDIAASRNLIEKYKRSIKSSEPDSRFNLLVLAVKMLEYIEHPKIITNKFEHKFKKLIDRFKENFTTFNLIDYAIISSLARRLRCKEITAIVKDLYHWLETNHPEILAPALREIEERASKVKLIDGSKQSAA